MKNKNLYEHDLELTIANRARLQENKNLLYWYKKLYDKSLFSIPNIKSMRVLEIGSGVSALKHYMPSLITSDLLALDYLDYIFDCHEIATTQELDGCVFDLITMTNVLHHLQDPLKFLCSAASKLSQGGSLCIVEPYFSIFSYPIFRWLHHELVDFNIPYPKLESIAGPLTTSNQAIPHMIFFDRLDWLSRLSDYYDIEYIQYGYFTFVSYMLTGGISKKFPVPHSIYKIIFALDSFLARVFPKIFASFFIVQIFAKK